MIKIYYKNMYDQSAFLTINNDELKNSIINYFILCNPNKKTKKNRLGKCKIDINGMMEIYIYGTPRSEIDALRKPHKPHELAQEKVLYKLPHSDPNKKPVELGGFRIKWNVVENTFTYVYPAKYKEVETYGDYYGSDYEYNEDKYVLYETAPTKVTDENYLLLMERTKSYINTLYSIKSYKSTKFKSIELK